MSFFRVKSKLRLADLKVGDRIEESDFATITKDDEFVQLEHIEDVAGVPTYAVKPGIWTIQRTSGGFKLEPTSFTDDAILTNYVGTLELEKKIDCFFNNQHVYKERKIEIPRRSALLFGPAGVGKTVSIVQVSNKYVRDGKTAVVIWATDKFDAFEVKDFIKTFKYEGVEKIIVVAEDIGGVEVDQVRIKSMSSLLSLLDNKEKTFSIPVFIIATTNHPENFLGNLTNRPGRFDDKIETTYPKPSVRQELLKFFTRGTATAEELEQIGHKKFNEFSVAHIQEAELRSALHSITLGDALTNVLREIEEFKKEFDTKKQKLGFGIENDYED